MRDPALCILPDRAIPGLSILAELPETAPLQGVLLKQALATEWTTDAYFVGYHAVDGQGWPAYFRINKIGPAVGSIREQGGDVRASVLTLELDLPGENGEKRAWTDAAEIKWFGEILWSSLHAAGIPLPSATWTTLHGCRFLYVLTRDVPVEEAEGLIGGLLRDYIAAGIPVDVKCKDWTRLMGLPRVIRHGVTTGSQWWFKCWAEGQELDPASIKPTSVTVTEYVEVAASSYDMPSVDEARAMIWMPDQQHMTPWGNTAKLWLQGRDAFDVCFEYKAISAERGRNNELTRLIGQACGMLYGKDGASPEGVYALFSDAIQQLEPDAGTPDWYRAGWELCVRLWNAEAQQRAAKISKPEMNKAETFPSIVASLAATNPDAPTNKFDLATWAAERLMLAAPNGKHFYLMTREGVYSSHATPASLLLPTIRDMGLDGVICTTNQKGKTLVPRDSSSIVAAHAIPVHRIECSSSVPANCVEERGNVRAFIRRVHLLRTDLEPTFSPQVDEWLRRLAGPSYNQLSEWLSYCLQVEAGICALALIGASGAGKNMLVQGIAECFVDPHPNGEACLGKFNDGLMDNPVVWLDEGVPLTTSSQNSGRTPDQVIRSLTAGGEVKVEPKGMPVMHAFVYPRVIVTANNVDIIASLCGRKDLSEQDLAAIRQRLLYVDARLDAKRHLTALGNRAYTRGWVNGEGGNRYTLARHILHLFKNRVAVTSGTNRLLVEGTKDNRLLADYAVRTVAARAVIRTLLEMIEATHKPEGMMTVEGRVYVLPSAIVRYFERFIQQYMRTDLNTKSVAKILRLICHMNGAQQPDACVLPGQGDAIKQHWWQPDLAVLLNEALAGGHMRKNLEHLYVIQHGANGLANFITHTEAIIRGDE